ncbi:MAG TPA: hypothetical protein VEW69_07395, partial [Alphaproteobacteria bacterium]|nr:hypothetical protein [Alphaproteobacteria bacterium]
MLSHLIVFSIILCSAQARGQSPPAPSDLDTLTRNGFKHFYAQEYDPALRDFQKVLEARPNDPASINHLLEAVLFGELFKYNALDTQMYTSLKFLGSKQVPVDPETRKKIKDLAERSINLSSERLKANPGDAQALYTRGVAEGLRATYLAVVEHSWFAALRSALSARHDHEQVLKLKPDFVDAKMIVGAHNYIVGNLSVPIKIMAGITGIHGDKEKGLQYLTEAANGGGESSADARVALALFLRKEGRHKEAIDVVHALTREHPRNFLFALEEGNLLKDSGQNAEAVA